jgi:hypothetical protein
MSKKQSAQGANVKSGLSDQQKIPKGPIRGEGGKNQIPHPQKDGRFKY